MNILRFVISLFSILIFPFVAYSESVTPEIFGAKGDGITDDTYAVQRAFDKSDDVHLTGTYRCRQLTINHNIKISGGTLLAFLDDEGNTTPLLKSVGQYEMIFHDVVFDGSVTVGAKASVEPQLFLEFEGQKKILFDKCTIRNHGIISKNFAECWYLRNNYALRVLGVKKIEFRNCEFYGNREECVCIGSNSNTRGKKTYTELLVRDCVSHDNNKPGSQALFLLFNLKSGRFENCHFKDQGTAFINSMSSNIQVTSCTFANTPNRAITSEDLGAYYNCRNMYIKDNIIINCREAAISVGGENIQISGNTIENCGTESCILVGRLICGNNFYGNTARKAIPYFDGRFSMNRSSKNITIEGNTIKGAEKIGILVYCNYQSDDGSIAIKKFGSFRNVDICNNHIENVPTPIQFGNGFYYDVKIADNILKGKGISPIILTTSNVKKFKGAFEGLTIEGNSIVAETFHDYLFVIENATTKRLKVKDNKANNDYRKSEYIQKVK